MTTVLNTRFENSNDSPGLLLWLLTNKWQARQRSVLKPFDLTHVQFVLLATLTYAVDKNTFTQKRLADYAQTDVMMTSQVIRKLAQKGLVRREADKLDSRAVALRPTETGILLVNKAVQAVEVVDEEFFNISATDQAHLMRIFRELAGQSIDN